MTPDLSALLLSLEGKPYPAYKALRGRRDRVGPFTFAFESIQGDPFAAPSRLSVLISPSLTGLPQWAKATRLRRTATADFLHRKFRVGLGYAVRGEGSGKSGSLSILSLGQEILERSACQVHEEGSVEVKCTVGLPARGRRILGRQAEVLILDTLPGVLRSVLETLDPEALRHQLDCVEDQEALRAGLAKKGLVGFVADGSILPRASGVDDRPMKDAVPFHSPKELAVTLETPHSGHVRGMGIRRGITLIVGGGYHGKSTLLKALARGIYNRIPGDGRHRVVVDPDAVWIRAEDGRAVRQVDLRPFIHNLPLGRETRSFSTEDASGSTSQAAAVMESLEMGATTLLIDEDIAATNFMIRDGRMRDLIPASDEPITPFLDRVRALEREAGVSSILVVGGAGDYLGVADQVIQMESYQPKDLTEKARDVMERWAHSSIPPSVSPWPGLNPRSPILEEMDPVGSRRKERIRASGTRSIVFGEDEIDLVHLEQLVDPAQARMIGDVLLRLHREAGRGSRLSIREAVESVVMHMETHGILSVSARGHGDRAMTRKYEIAAALNRMRSLRFTPIESN